MKRNLLSVSQLTTEFSCLFEFTNCGFVIKDQRTRQILASGIKQGGLYTLSDSKPKEALFSTRFKTTSEDLWHQRLGHPHPRIIWFLNNIKFLHVDNWNRSSYVCEGCQLSKSYKLPFYPSSNISSAPLHKIHCDLWGPAPTRSTQGYRFYTIFVEDFSCYVWWFPLKHKSGFYDRFKNFSKFYWKANGQENSNISVRWRGRILQ